MDDIRFDLVLNSTVNPRVFVLKKVVNRLCTRQHEPGAHLDILQILLRFLDSTLKRRGTSVGRKIRIDKMEKFTNNSKRKEG